MNHIWVQSAPRQRRVFISLGWVLTYAYLKSMAYVELKNWHANRNRESDTFSFLFDSTGMWKGGNVFLVLDEMES